MRFKDHFSGHAALYARYRPEYPAALFEFLAQLTPRRETALDCATGSGQAAVSLAQHFERVIATDASVQQLLHAQRHPRVFYVASFAERPGLRDGSVDLVTVAQAAHWFDHEHFYAEVRRVLRADGALAAWTYGRARIDPEIDELVDRFYEHVVGPYWPPERQYIEDAYRTLPFPLREVPAPSLELRVSWDLDTFVGYLGTWSAVQRYTKAVGRDPLPDLREQIAPYWSPAGALRWVCWPLYIRAGRP